MKTNDAIDVLMEVKSNASLRRDLICCTTTYEVKELFFNCGFILNFAELEAAIVDVKNSTKVDDVIDASAKWLASVLMMCR